MQTLVLFFDTLFSNILSNRIFTSFVTYGIGKVSFTPEIPTSQYFFGLRHFFKYFLRGNTFHYLNNFRWTLCWTDCIRKCTWFLSVPISINTISYLFPISRQIFLISLSTSLLKTTFLYFAGQTK